MAAIRRETTSWWWEGPCPEWVRTKSGRADWAAGARSFAHDCRWGGGRDVVVDPDLVLASGKPVRSDLPGLRKILVARGVPKRALSGMRAGIVVVDGLVGSRRAAAPPVYRPPAGAEEESYARTCAARVRALTSDPGCGLVLTDVDRELAARFHPDVWARFVNPGVSQRQDKR